jgi:hypothetical protein
LTPAYDEELVSGLIDSAAAGDRGAVAQLWKLVDDVPKPKAEHANGSGGCADK